MSDLDDLKEKVAQSCRMLGKLDLTREPAGHVSARIPGSENILIKARGESESGVRYTDPSDIVIVTPDAKLIDGAPGQAVPREVFIHTWLYRTRPDVNCVIHVHPPTVVLFTIVGKPLLPVYGAFDPAGLSILLAGIPNYDRSILISNDSLGEELAKTIGDKNIVMMRGHGVTSCGPSIESATLTVVRVNDLAEMNYRAHLLGEPRPIPDIDLQEFAARGERGDPSSTGRRDSAWEAWKRIAEER